MSGLAIQIRSWAVSELKPWEQAALEMIASGDEITDKRIAELVGYFIEDSGLAPKGQHRHTLSLPDDSRTASDKPTHKLHRISNLRNVNALPETQEVLFGSELTLIYGENGAGKTGYVRPLASAGFARGPREVLPDATKHDKRAAPQADIEITEDAGTRLIKWTHGKPTPELRSVYVFDGDSIVAHLTRSNALTFSPSGLLLLTRLVDVTDLVRERVRTMAEKKEKPNDLHLLFDGDSRVRQIILTLGPLMDVPSLERLANLSESELELAKNLEREIAELRLLDIPKQIARREQEIKDLENLSKSITKAQSELGQTTEAQVRTLIESVTDDRTEVERSGADQFKFGPFQHVGSPEWINFLAAAKRLADGLIAQGRAYPAPDEPCLLCRQPLTTVGAALIERFWRFMASDTQAKLETSQTECAKRRKALESIPLEYFKSDSNVRRLLEAEHEIIIPAIEAQRDACVERRSILIEALSCYEFVPPPPLLNVNLEELEQLSEIRRRGVEQLNSSDVGQRLAKAETALRELTHRQMLGKKLPEIRQYIDDIKWAAMARQFLGSTRAITTKYNDLFKELVTDKYVSLFEKTLGRFKKNIRVSVETRGAKGETVRQIVLGGDSFSRPYPVSQILSEGEKRVVAISDFLAEVSLDKNCSTVVLDDPVTSLDVQWKDTIALCLAELAKVKQVVIFTHDLAFMYSIKSHADELLVPIVSHWIKDEDGHPGFVYQDNSPACEKDYKSARKAQELYAKTKGMPPEEQQRIMQQAFGALRTSYEALIIFELFNGVVERFEERIRFDRLAQVRIDTELVDQIIKRMGALSRHIDAHLHSDNYSPVKPTPADLLEEINLFEEIRKKQRELKPKK